MNPSDHSRRHQPAAGIAFALLAMTAFSWQDALVKHLAAEYSLFQILFIRSTVIVSVLFFILFFRNGIVAFRTGRPLDHALRVAFNLAAFLAYYYAVTRIDLAQATAIAMSSPLISISLSGLILGERARPMQFLIAAIGFTGVILVIRPASGPIDWLGTTAALFSALMFTMLFLQTRKMTVTESTGLMVFYAALAFLCITGIVMPSQWSTPVGHDWTLLLGLGAVSMIAQLCIVQASYFAPVHILAPFEYVTILWALILGWHVFAEMPSALMLFGAGVIVACGLVIIRMEHRSKISPS